MEDKKFTRKSTQDNYVSERIDIIKNNLLGNYDNAGNYQIAPQIVNELLELEKYRKSSYGNSMFCVGNLLGYGEIVFEVYFNKDVDGETNAKACLYVLEDIDKVNGYLQNTIKTLIAEFSSDVGNFIEDSYKKFKIKDTSDDDDEEGKEKKDLESLELDDSYILAKKAYMLLLEKLEEEKMLDAYGKLFTEKLSLISKMDNEFAKAVLDRFNSQYALIENIFLKDKNYKALNELMDACIEYVSGTQEQFIAQEKEFNDKLAPALQTFTENLNELSEKSEKKALNMLDREDRAKLQEMIDANENIDENEAVTDNDSTGDGAVELEPSIEVIQEMNNEGGMETLGNPILYEGSDDELEEESEKNEEQSEQEESQQNNQQENQVVQEEQTIEEIIKNNKIEEPINSEEQTTENKVSEEKPTTANTVSEEKSTTENTGKAVEPTVIDTSRTKDLEQEDQIVTEKKDTPKTIDVNPEKESKDISEIIEKNKKEETKPVQAEDKKTESSATQEDKVRIPDSLMDYIKNSQRLDREKQGRNPETPPTSKEQPLEQPSNPTPTKTDPAPDNDFLNRVSNKYGKLNNSNGGTTVSEETIEEIVETKVNDKFDSIFNKFKEGVNQDSKSPEPEIHVDSINSPAIDESFNNVGEQNIESIVPDGIPLGSDDIPRNLDGQIEKITGQYSKSFDEKSLGDW